MKQKYGREEVRFVRINGRVVPIRKRKAEGITALGTGAMISAGAALKSADIVKEAHQFYGRSANLRGASKLVFSKGSPTYRELIRNAAVTRIAGKRLARKGFGTLALGLGLGSALVTLGIKKLSPKNQTEEETMAKAATATGLVTAGALGIFGRKANLDGLVKIARKAKGKKAVDELFGLWSKNGIRKTTNTIRKYSRATYKGVKPKPKDVFKGKQQDLFGQKPFGMRKLLGKD